MNVIRLLGMGLIGLLVLSGVFLMKRWQFNECMKVGHSETYCLLSK
jgi:hypothetical protein